MQGSFASNWTNSLRGGGNRETGQAATRRRQRAGSAGTQRQPSAPASAPLTAREPTGKNVLYADPYSARGEGEARPSRSDTAEAAIPWRPAPRGAFEVEARDVAVTNAEPPSLGAAASVDNLLYSREAALRERLRESEGEARTLGDQVARWDALRERLQRAEDIERNRAEDERARAQQREQARQAAASRSPPAPRAVRRGWGENTAHTGNGREEPRRTGRGGPVEAGSGAPGAADALPSSAGMFGLAVAPKGRGGPPLAPALLLNGPSPRRRALSGDAAVTDAVGTSSPHGRLSPTAMSRSPSRRASGRLRPLVPPPDAEDGTAGGGAGGSLCVQGSPATPGPDEEPRSRLARMQRSVSHSVVPTGPPPRGGGDSSGASASPAAGGRPAPPTRSRSPVRSQGRIGRRTATPAGDARGLCAQGQALRLGSMAPAARHAFMRRWSALRRLTAEMGRASRGRQILELSRTASASSARHPDSAGARGADWLWGGNPPQAWAAHEEDTAAGDGESGGGGGYSPEAGAGLPPLDLGALRSPPRAASTLSRTASMDSARSQVEACAALAQCTPERVLCKMGSAMLDHLCDEVRHHVAGVDEGREGEGESGDDGEYGVDMGDEDEEEEEEEDSATEEGRSTESDSYTEPGSPPPSQADDDNGHRHDALASLLPDPAYHEAEGAGGGTDHAGADPAPRRQHSAALPARLQLNEAGMGLEHHSGGTPSGERGTPVLLDELGTPVEMRRRMAHGGQQGREREEEDRRFQATGVDRREGEEEKAEEKAEGDEDETPSMRLRMRASGLTREAVEASAVLRNQPPGRVAAAARKVAHDRGERGAVGEGEAQSSARRRRRGRGRRESAGGAGGGVARQLVFERVIGRGASGKVHLARLEPLEGEGGQGAGPEWVAVKQVSLRDSSVQALDEVLHLEVRLLRRLRHPHIVRYKGFHASRSRARCNIILEYVDGGSLQQRLKARRRRGYPVDRVASVARQVLSGLRYLHSQHVIHRDLKPGNLLVTRDGSVKIADFDVSTQVCGMQTMQRSVVGTPWYTAPEIIQVEPYGPRADVWSLGCCILELATGKCPHAGLNEVQAMFRMVQDAHPEIPPSLPDSLRDFLLQCFRRPARLRPHAAELLHHPFLQMGAGVSRPLSPLQSPPPSQPAPSPAPHTPQFGCPSLEAPLNKL